MYFIFTSEFFILYSHLEFTSCMRDIKLKHISNICKISCINSLFDEKNAYIYVAIYRVSKNLAKK